MVKKIVSTLPDTLMSASVVDKDTDHATYLRGIEAGAGVKIEVVDADDNKFQTPEKKIRISTVPGGVFRYMGVLHAGQDALPSAPIQGDFYRIVGFGNFGGATVTLNVGDGITWNGSSWDKQDNTDPHISGIPNRIQVAGTGDTGYIIDIDAAYKGQTSIDTVGIITSGTWLGSIIDLAHGGSGANLTSVPNNSLIVKNGTSLGGLPLPSVLDTSLTHTASGYAWLPRGEINTASNTGTAPANSGAVFAQKVGSDLQFRRIVGGSNVTITEAANTITISSVDTGEVNTASNLGTSGATVFAQKQGVDFQFKRIKAGPHVTVTEDATSITIASDDFDVAVRGTSGLPVFHQRVGNTFEFKRIAAGNNINLTSDADSITINATNVGEVNTSSNLGAGAQVFAQKNGVDFQFRSLIGTGVISVAQGTNDITITTTAEANTASNVGASGARVFAQKSGVDLQFRKIRQGAGIIVQENPDDILISAIPQKRLQDADNNTFIEVDGDGAGSLDTIEMRVGGQKALELTKGSIVIAGNIAQNGTNTIGANVTISAGNSDGVANGAVLTLRGGAGGSVNGNGGLVDVTSGDAGGGNANGGDILLTLGRPTGTGVHGGVIVRNHLNERAFEVASQLGSPAHFKVVGTKLLGVGGTSDIEITPNGGKVKLGGLFFPGVDGTAGQVIATDGLGNLYWTNDVGEVNTGFNRGNPTAVGAVATVFAGKVGPELQFRNIVAGPNVSVMETADSIVISSQDTGEVNIGANVGTGAAVYKEKNNSVLFFRKITGNGLINVTEGSDEITITTTAEANNVVQRGYMGVGVVELFAQKTGSDFEFRRMQAGNNMVLQQDTNYVTFGTTAEINDAENVGGGLGVYKNTKNGTKLQFHSLLAGSNINLSVQNDSIVITAVDVGEVNTAANLGSGTGIYANKSGSELQFKSLVASGSVSINTNAETITIGSLAEVNAANNVGTAGANVFANKNTTTGELNFRKIEGNGLITVVEDAVRNTIVVSTSAASVNYVNAGLAPKANAADLHLVATTGSYADLNNKPTLGSASSRDIGTSAGNIPVLDAQGKLNDSIIPALAITNVFAVGDNTARDALVVQTGDVAINTTSNVSYIWDGSSWKELRAAGYVTSVAGKTGNVSLVLDDLVDAAILAPDAGQVLRYTGSTWQNARLSFLDLSDRPYIPTKFDDLSDVDVGPSPVIGETVRWNGTRFVNAKLDYNDVTGLSTIAHTGVITDATGNLPANRVSGLANIATSGAYTDLSGVPTLVSAFTNDANYITSAQAPVQSVAGKSGVVTLVAGDVGGLGDLATKNEADLNLKAFAHKDTVDYSEVLNTPTLGSAAASDTTDFASATHNHDSSYAAITHTHVVADITDFPALGSLAAKNTVDYTADVTNKPVAAAVADIIDTVNASPEDCANKINELLASLRAAGLLAV